MTGKIIRDAIHGDIFIPESFMEIIDTPEFQRLRRIRQLSTAYTVYPCAEHTRFSHSIGTFFVMNLIIKHFHPIFESIAIKLKNQQINLALAVALLHDIGHGPFSHAFENALPINNKEHEEWTIEIVTSNQSKVFQILTKNFGNDFPRDVADLIKKDRDVKKHRKELKTDSLDLFFVLSSLISSQLDADRMDYLLRDSYFAGVSYGLFDLERLIRSLTLTEFKNNYYVCIQEKYLSVIEEYLLSRYQMHQNVYLHSFKCETELVVKKIIHRAYELYTRQEIDVHSLPSALVTVFSGEDMTIEEYISLDDSVLISLFANWAQLSDPIISRLCTVFLNRGKYFNLAILDNSEEDIDSFKTDFIEIINRYERQITDFEKNYFWLKEKVKNVTYKNGKENIWVLRNDGTVCDLTEISRVITNNLSYEKNYLFIDFEMLKLELKVGDNVVEELKNLISMYNNKNYIEIEKKYYFDKRELVDQVLEVIKNDAKYEIKKDDTVKQTDYYYDTSDGLLNKNDKTLRIRIINDEYFLTVKTPTKQSSCITQSERFEYETKITSMDILEAREHFLKYLPELSDSLDDLSQNLRVENTREKFRLSKKDIIFEMAFDDIIYYRCEDQAHEYEIEIELKSDYIHRINLKMLSDCLINKLPNLEPINDSKYQRGLKALGHTSSHQIP